jgi:hypothetical protein
MQTFEFLAAKFGPLIPADGAPIMGRLVMARPEDGCVGDEGSLENARAVSGNIMVVMRGKCMFPDKVGDLACPLPGHGASWCFACLPVYWCACM